MKTQAFNLFIVDDNPLLVASLRNYLDKKFGSDITISTFLSGKSALEKVDADTKIVILDHNLEGEDGNEVLKSIKGINANTKVIMLTSNEDLAVAIDAFRNGASDYIIKGERSWERISSQVFKTVMSPLNVLVKEFGVNKYLAGVLLTFAAISTGIYFALKFIS